MASRDRTVTVRFEGVDHRGEGFLFERCIDASGSGDNPRLYGEQLERAIARAGESIREAVEHLYGTVPDAVPRSRQS
jgi:hypothetical protein